jgi:hypothetical protein
MLKSVRPTIACLTLASLLLSNFAGWVHVGCADADSTCCFSSVGPSRQQAQRSELVRDRSQSTHACCHHNHRPAEPLHGDEAGDSDQPTPVDHHDSDRCSVCKGFYTCRLGTVLTCDVIVVEMTQVDSTPICPAPTWSGDPLYSSISVRGPPRV